MAAALVLVGLLHLLAALIWPRPWYGPPSWRKPVTFGLSFGSTLAAVAWVSTYVTLRDRRRTILLGIFAVDCVVEVLGIAVQAWRHVPSHFNTESGFDTAIAFTLAAGGAVLILVLGSLAFAAFRSQGRPAMVLALRAGFGLMLAGLAAGVAMIVRAETLIGDGHRQAAYDHAGFLKWFHAVTLHAVLVLPLLAWWVLRTGRDDVAGLRIVRRGVAANLAAAAATLIVCLAQL